MDKFDVYRWWGRRITQYVLSGITCIFLVLSLARIFDVNLINWPAFLQWIAQSYGDALIWTGNTIINLLSSIPAVAFDVLTAYLLIGALMRLSVIDIGLKTEKNFLDRGPDFWDDQWLIEGIKETRKATNSEFNRFRFLWFIRLFSDLKGGKKYFKLTPIRMLIYLLIVIALFVGAIFIFGYERA